VPLARLEGPITTGTLSPPFDPRATDVAAIGYVEEEWFASGVATRYQQNGERTRDGRWELTAVETAPYRTRIVIRMPSDPADFSGIVVLEWLNVTVFELSPDWAYLGDAIVRNGIAWIGISAQALGIEGGASLMDTGVTSQAAANQGLKATNPTRYSSLTHPGDAYAFDIYSQVGAALRGEDGKAALQGADVTRLLAIGESQSAVFLTAYVNGVAPLAQVFDGYFVHSRFDGAADFDGRPRVVDADARPGYQIRTDLDVPVFVFETETDVIRGYGLARQPDTDLLRVWEVAGTGHSDTYLAGGHPDLWATPINDGPQHWVVDAAFTHLIAWVTDGCAPPHGTPIESDGTRVRRDDHGIALGGIRTPDVDVPVATLSGAAPPGADPVRALLGSTTPFDEQTLRSLYPSKEVFVERFTASLDDAIARGYVRASDRAAYLARADAADIPS
jgi:hypothetical protein